MLSAKLCATCIIDCNIVIQQIVISGDDVIMLVWYFLTAAAECDLGVCLNNATCLQGFPGFMCECVPGFSGDTCDQGMMIYASVDC